MLGLDLTDVSETGTPLPDGAYGAVVDKAVVSPTKSGGEMIKVQMKVLDGPHAGRVIFDQFNIKNANPQAVQIGLGQLKGLLKASGFPNPNRLDSAEQLAGLKVTVRTKTEESEGYGPQTRVKGYGVYGGAGAQAQGGATAAPAAAANPFA